MRVFAEIAAHPGLAQFMPVRWLSADEDRDLAGMVRGGSDHVRSDAANLQVVETQVVSSHPLPEIVQQGKAGMACVWSA